MAKPLQNQNKTTIKITWSSYDADTLAKLCASVLLLRFARKVGDIETVSQTVLGKVNDYKATIHIEIHNYNSI